MIRAIAVDMDGTFLDTNKEYDKARFEIIYQVKVYFWRARHVLHF